MVTSSECIFRDSKVELVGSVPDGVSEARVTVTFPTPSEPADLAARGINARQAADLRARLSAFTEDWERPEMDVYDADCPKS
jgi:hypothetical protein